MPELFIKCDFPSPLISNVNFIIYYIYYLLSISICGFLFHLTIDFSFNVSILERISCLSNQKFYNNITKPN